MEKKKRSIVFGENERTVSVLGQGYLDSFLSGGGISKTIMVLTDKRLYVRGKKIDRAGISMASVDFNVNDITGTVSSEKSRLFFQIFFALLGIAAFAHFLEENVLIGLGALAVAFVLILLCANVKYMGIISHGTEFQFPLSNYPKDEILSFRREIALMVEQNREK